MIYYNRNDRIFITHTPYITVSWAIEKKDGDCIHHENYIKHKQNEEQLTPLS